MSLETHFGVHLDDFRFAVLIDATQEQTSPLVVRFDDEAAAETCSFPDESTPAPVPLQLFQETPIAIHCIRTARDSGAQGTCIVASKATAYAIKSAVEQSETTHGCPVEYAFNSEAAHDSNIDLFGLDGIVLRAALSYAERNDVPYLYILSASEPRVNIAHLEALRESFFSMPNRDVSSSWANGRRGTPLLISAAYLKRELSRFDENVDPAGFVPSIRIAEKMFPKQNLRPPRPNVRPSTDFTDRITITAIEAVRLAKIDLADDMLADLNNEDKGLVTAARDAIAAMRPHDASETQDLENADALCRKSRRDFPFFDDPKCNHEVYLDSAATSHRLGRALSEQYRFDTRCNANVYRGVYRLSEEATNELKSARKSIGSFIEAGPEEIILTANCSAAISLAAAAWGENNITPESTIVITIGEHHSNMLPWITLARRKNAHVIFIPLDQTGRVDLDAYEKALAEKPSIVCCSHVGNVLGMINPVEHMVELAHEKGARFFLDAAQSIAHGLLDVTRIHPDFAAFSAHKMYGPLGIGGLWVDPDILANEMKPFTSGGGAVTYVSEREFFSRSGVYGYEIGTPAVSAAVGWAAAADYLREIGRDRIHTCDSIMTKCLVRGLKTIPRLVLYGDHLHPDGGCGLVSFGFQNDEPTPVVKFLDKLGIAVRGGNHCALPVSASIGSVGTVRISLGIYNTKEDIEAAVAAILAYQRLEGPGRTQ